jgi:hypothetical protein
MAILAAIGTLVAVRIWPANDPDVIAHEHGDLANDDPHLAVHSHGDHPYVIDRRHPKWPGK